jgi:hypothetical protein
MTKAVETLNYLEGDDKKEEVEEENAAASAETVFL